MNDLLAVLPQLVPLLPRLIKAVQTVEKLSIDPDVKDAIAAVEQLAAIFQTQAKRSP